MKASEAVVLNLDAAYVSHIHNTLLISSPGSVLQEFPVQEGDVFRGCWSVDERRHPTDSEESVCLLAVCVGSQQQ